MELAVFNLKTAHHFGSCFYDFLVLRKRYFVDQLGWKIPHDDEVEMDQYDTPQAHYAVVRHHGRVVGGARMMPTTHQWGQDRYMLRDAADGKLPGIPAKIVPAGFEGPQVWECTRLVFDDMLTDSERVQALDLVVEGVLSAARARGATCMVALSQVALIRAIRKLGYDPRQAGPAYRDPQSGRALAVLTMAPWKTGEIAAAA